jgi:hypothetical protein
LDDGNGDEPQWRQKEQGTGMAGRIKLIVRRDADGEYVNYDKMRFAIHWNIPIRLAPSQHYPILAQKSASDYDRTVTPRLLVYRYPEGEEMIGHADAYRPY